MDGGEVVQLYLTHEGVAGACAAGASRLPADFILRTVKPCGDIQNTRTVISALWKLTGSGAS